MSSASELPSPKFKGAAYRKARILSRCIRTLLSDWSSHGRLGPTATTQPYCFPISVPIGVWGNVSGSVPVCVPSPVPAPWGVEEGEEDHWRVLDKMLEEQDEGVW